jgi:hypothetical protein
MVCVYGLASANLLNMRSRKVNGVEGVPPACDVADLLKTLYSKVYHGTDCYTEHRSRSDYLERPTQGTTDAKFGTWIFRRFF